ncbi:MAG: TlpA disulfide reductase family protein [Pseudomonadota bacterium]
MRRDHQAARRQRPVLSALLYSAVATAAIGMGAVAFPWSAPALAGPIGDEARAEIRGLAETALPNLVVHDEPRGPWGTPFKTGEDVEMTLADFSGEVVVLNLWATWCPPCRAEMPSLDRLAGALDGTGATVVTLSTDRGGAPKVRDFFEDVGIANLEIYVDKANRLPREAAVLGLPVTMILDRDGREIARLTGDAEWDAPEIVSMINRITAMTSTDQKKADAADRLDDAAAAAVPAGSARSARPVSAGERRYLERSPLSGTAL